MKILIAFSLCFWGFATAQNIPNDKIIPPESLFGDRFDRSENEQKWNEYLDGKPIEISGDHEIIRLEFTEALLATLLIVVCKDSETAVANFEDGRKKMVDRGMSTLSEVVKTKDRQSFTIETLGRHACSIVLKNVHFVINDPVANLSKDEVVEWSEKYAEFLTSGIKPAVGEVKKELLFENWTGSNGKTIQGMIHGISGDGLTVDFTVKGGKRIPSLPLAKFSDSDQERICKRFK